MKRFTLNKSQKLKGVKAVRALFTDCLIATSFPLKAVYTFNKRSVADFKVGFSVAKRKVNKAHDRNRIKRNLREVFRQNKSLLLVDNEIKYQISVMFIYLGEKTIKQQVLKEKMEEVINKINNNINREK
ncbi:MAG: ribonuclease P protein component [Saprospiraceae bacterium]|jgi:ribonuclease P protein component